MAQVFRSSPKSAATKGPSWAWLLFGFGLGLIVATVIYLSDWGDAVTPATLQQVPEPLSQKLDSSPETETPHPAERFDFYEVLAKFEVVIPRRKFPAHVDTDSIAVIESSHFVLQAGSFTEHSDALRMQASLALLEITSDIQKVTIDDDTFHRVRVGPITNLVKLRALQRQLKDADVEILLLRVPN